MIQTIDFLGIGAQKAATSWLWQNLRQHPHIWLPPRKELHYFDRSPIYPSPSFLASTNLVDRLLGSELHNKHFRKQGIAELGKAVMSRDLKKIRWNLRYYFGTYHDDWYVSLFKEGAGKLKGEITPSYSMLNLEDVKHIREIFPELKIILMLRNPIERAWSHVRYAWTGGVFNNMDEFNMIKKFIDAPGQCLRSDYVRMLDIWTSCFPKEQIYIGFYDDVVQDPQKLILDILDFLGVDNTEFSSAGALNSRVNVSKAMKIPTEVKFYLANKYYPELQKLSKLIGSHATVWLKEAEQLLNGAEHGAAADRS